jgi:hypothetical protein
MIKNKVWGHKLPSSASFYYKMDVATDSYGNSYFIGGFSGTITFGNKTCLVKN